MLKNIELEYHVDNWEKTIVSNPFVLEKKEYIRDIDILNHYLKDSATYLNLMTGKPINECLSFIKNSLQPGGEFQFVDPKIQYLCRGENEDRVELEGTLSVYINESVKNNELIAPTLTTYINPKIRKSLLVDFVEGNIKGRNKAKKEMFTAKMSGDKVTEAIKKSEQTNRKLSNNSVSGAHCSAGTPFYNKTSHSTLTSNCRSTSGYGNANNEKFLCGNRHYWSPDIIRNNIISIINHTNYVQLELVINKYNIKYPTIEETIACYRYSSDLYWKGFKDHATLELLISKLSDIQRAAFVYTGDLYHLMKLNNALIYNFIDKLSNKIQTPHLNPHSVISKTPNGQAILTKVPDDQLALAGQICTKELLDAIPIDKVDQKTTNLLDIIDSPYHGMFASTIENISNTLNEYSDFIRIFFVTENVPASVSVFPSSIRRSAITSDTDSTIFTVQDWVIWHRGKVIFDDKAIGVAATMIFLAAQSIIHVLARMSANFGIDTDKIHQIAMKNEYFFPIFTPTDKAKHYYALISCQEGNIFRKYEKEIKGVHLKSSNVPKSIIKDAEKMILFIMNEVVAGRKISIKHITKWIADKEREIEKSILKGDYDYFRLGQIKTANSYKQTEEAAAYKQYLLWEEVFAPKYGSTVKPPYMVIKVGMNIDTPTLTRDWIADIKDRELANRLEKWLVNNNKTSFGGTLLLPEQVISAKGIPEEVAIAIGVRDIIYDITSIYYTILETLGIYITNKKKTNMCYDLI